VFREHYKQLGSTGVRRVRRGQLDRVTAKVQVASQSAECKVRRTFTKKEMERAVADLPTYKAGDAADLKVSSSKLAGRGQTAPEASELGMGTGDPAHSVVARGDR
jgi:hypothetical protein